MNTKKLINNLKMNVGDKYSPPTPFYLKLVETYALRPITSQKQYEPAIKVAEELVLYMNTNKEKDEGMESYLSTLSGLISEYEKNNIKSAASSGGDMLAYLMDLHGLKQADLAKELGGQSVVSKILNNKIELSTKQIRALAKRFKVSESTFLP